MYGEFYGFAHPPFSLSPDVRFIYRHPSFARARAYLHYALYRGEGFVMITGSPGTGKTTLVQDLLGELGQSGHLVASVESTQVDADDLLRLVVYAFGVRVSGSDKATLLYELKEFLQDHTTRDKRAIIVIDEAQNLPIGSLEELRLITNLQREAQPLLQIFLVGQEALRDTVRRPELQQLHQRIIAACHLDLLGLEETRNYMEHRLLRAGWSGDPVFEAGAIRRIYSASGGVPRLVNKFCDRLLLYGSLEERHSLSEEDAQVVLEDLREESLDHTEDAVQSDSQEVVADLVFEVAPDDEPAVREVRQEAREHRGAEAHADLEERTLEPQYAAEADLRGDEASMLPGVEVSSSAEPESTHAVFEFGGSALPSGAHDGFEASPTPGVEPTVAASNPPPPRSDGAQDGSGVYVSASNVSAAYSFTPTPVVEQPVVVPTAESTPTAAMAKKPAPRRSPSFLPYLMVVFVLLAVIGVGYLFYRQIGGTAGVAQLNPSAFLEREHVYISERLGELRERWFPADAEPVSPVPGLRDMPVVDEGVSAVDHGVLPPVSSRDLPDLETSAVEPSATPARHAEAIDQAVLSAEGGITTQEPQVAAPEAGSTTGSRRVTESGEMVTEPGASRSDEVSDRGVGEKLVTGTTDAESTADVAGVSKTGGPLAEVLSEQVVPGDASSTDASEGSDDTASEAAVNGRGDVEKVLREIGLTPREEAGGGLAVDLVEELRFDSDSSKIPSEAHGVLDALARLVGRYPNMSVTIIGHTDSVGPREYNRALSLKRAQSVERYLRDRGVDGERLSSEGRGEGVPALAVTRADGTLSPRHLRRIEVVLKPRAVP